MTSINSVIAKGILTIFNDRKGIQTIHIWHYSYPPLVQTWNCHITIVQTNNHEMWQVHTKLSWNLMRLSNIIWLKQTIRKSKAYFLLQSFVIVFNYNSELTGTGRSTNLCIMLLEMQAEMIYSVPIKSHGTGLYNDTAGRNWSMWLWVTKPQC